MRRVILLAILALALPTGVLANSFNFSIPGTEGGFSTGSISGFDNPFFVEVVSTNDVVIRLDTSTLTGPLGHCSPVEAPCTFTSGTLTVTDAGSTIFAASLSDGTSTRPIPFGNDNLIDATLVPGSCGPTIACAGGKVDIRADVSDGTDMLLSGSSAVVSGTTVIPEPGTLGMLGTGLIGLTGAVRRKLKLWT